MDIEQGAELLREQAAMIEGMAAGKKIEALLKKHGISWETFARWLNEPAFVRALSLRRQVMRLDSEFLLSRNGYDAAQKLIELMQTGDGEAQRKACLDGLNKAGQTEQTKNTSEQRRKPVIEEAKARRVLLEAAKRR